MVEDLVVVVEVVTTVIEMGVVDVEEDEGEVEMMEMEEEMIMGWMEEEIGDSVVGGEEVGGIHMTIVVLAEEVGVLVITMVEGEIEVKVIEIVVLLHMDVGEVEEMAVIKAVIAVIHLLEDIMIVVVGDIIEVGEEGIIPLEGEDRGDLRHLIMERGTVIATAATIVTTATTTIIAIAAIIPMEVDITITNIRINIVQECHPMMGVP
jgi:hypothetical protein